MCHEALQSTAPRFDARTGTPHIVSGGWRAGGLYQQGEIGTQSSRSMSNLAQTSSIWKAPPASSTASRHQAVCRYNGTTVNLAVPCLGECAGALQNQLDLASIHFTSTSDGHQLCPDCICYCTAMPCADNGTLRVKFILVTNGVYLSL